MSAPAVLAVRTNVEIASFAAIPPPEADPLEHLAVQIREGYKACLTAGQYYLLYAAIVGRALVEAKELVPHGTWEAWVEANCAFSTRQAQDYMRYARAIENGEIDPKTQSSAEALSIRQVLIRLRSNKSQHQAQEARSILPAWGRACDK